MNSLRNLCVLLVVVVASACSDAGVGQPAKSLPDTQENRTVVAKRYLEAMPPKDFLQAVAGRVVQNIPENDRKAFMQVMASQGIEEAAYRLTLDALVKDFTVGELNAMVAFYGSPDGQSAVKKFGPLMAGVMPQIQQQVKKALAEVSKPEEPKEPPKPKAQ